jgi:UMF1 family MFS transporter
MTADATAPERRALRGWLLYDFANSVFVTAVVTALGGPWLTALAAAADDSDGRLSLLGLNPRSASLYAYVTSASVLVQVLLLPLLGAATDSPQGRRRLLIAATSVGALATLALAVTPMGAWLLGSLALLVANVAYGAAILAYNAALSDVAVPEDRDRVSSRGFAAGYIGGSLHLAAVLAGLALAPSLDIGAGTVVRIAIASAGLWWFGVGIAAVRMMGRTERGAASSEPFRAKVLDTVRELRGSVREMRRLPLTARFLVAFLLFNDAIQAVVALSSVFLTQELYVARGLEAEDATSFLLLLVLLIQVVAIAGALGFARLAARVGAKRALLVSLAGWVAVVVYAYAALQTKAEAWALGVVIALVLGGSQALARSLFSRMVPEDRQSSFFGFYELAERGTAWIGTLIFAVVLDITGSYRSALLSLVVLLVSGAIVLVFTDTDAAIRAAHEPPDAPSGGPPGAGGSATVTPVHAPLNPTPAVQAADPAQRRRDLPFRAALVGLRLVVRLCTRTRRSGLAGVPADGALIVVGNHLSVADAFLLVDTVARAGRLPRVMGTGGVLTAPVIGPVLRSFGFIPVFRHGENPASALRPASEALESGECIALYPEGAITRLPGAWPARGRTGVVRLALESGAPIVPVAQWGTLDVAGEEGTRHRSLLLPITRPRVDVLVGPPIDLRAELGLGPVAPGGQVSSAQLRAGADIVMAALVRQLEVLRGEPAPEYAGRVPNPPKPERDAGRRRRRQKSRRLESSVPRSAS